MAVDSSIANLIEHLHERVYILLDKCDNGEVIYIVTEYAACSALSAVTGACCWEQVRNRRSFSIAVCMFIGHLPLSFYSACSRRVAVDVSIDIVTTWPIEFNRKGMSRNRSVRTDVLDKILFEIALPLWHSHTFRTSRLNRDIIIMTHLIN